MDYRVLDSYVEKITSAMRAGRDFNAEIDAAIKWAYEDNHRDPQWFTAYNNLVRALAYKLAEADKLAVPRTMKIIYRVETEAFARAKGYPLESELRIKYEPSVYQGASYTAENYRKLFHIPKAKELAEGIQAKLRDVGYDVELEQTSNDKDISLYLWIV